VQSNLKLNKNTTVVGYIGSLREMEGVDQTAEAVADLISKGHDIRFFVLTGKSGQTELKQLCENLGISENTVITGPVSHDKVAEYYDLIDIFVVSRPDTRVTRFVTPLKPFEAMAMGKCVIASNLPALEEIIQHEVTGLLYNPDSHLNLSCEIEKCLTHSELKLQIEQNAQNWVLENRKWEDLVQRTVGAYNLALEGRK
jgi:glycosyltransferase involved in cell wall biosynthesis